MQISLYKAETAETNIKRMAFGGYWVVTATMLGYELVVCSAPVARDIQQMQASS